eukprot:jgi/Botrbrau1/9965/Bobra.0012s0060.1
MDFSAHYLNIRVLFLCLAVSVRASEKAAAKGGSSPAGTWPYPQPPWTFLTSESWGFFGTHTVNGTHPPDRVPDPSLVYVSQPTPSGFAIIRYSEGPWGPWDQFLFEGSSARVGNGPAAGRVTQAYSSAVPPTLPEYPERIPHRLARFDWRHRSDGATDLKIFSPPNSTIPVFSIFGLSRLPFISFPITPELVSTLNLNTRFVQSVVEEYDTPGPILGHVIVEASFVGNAGVALYTNFETSDALDMDGGFYNVGLYVYNATTTIAVSPYPSA